MPCYDFTCPNDHTFEKIVLSYNQDQKVDCPTCGKKAKIVLLPGSRKNVKFLFNYMSPTGD